MCAHVRSLCALFAYIQCKQCFNTTFVLKTTNKKTVGAYRVGTAIQRSSCLRHVMILAFVFCSVVWYRIQLNYFGYNRFRYISIYFKTSQIRQLDFSLCCDLMVEFTFLLSLFLQCMKFVAYREHICYCTVFFQHVYVVINRIINQSFRMYQDFAFDLSGARTYLSLFATGLNRAMLY